MEDVFTTIRGKVDGVIEDVLAPLVASKIIRLPEATKERAVTLSNTVIA